MRSPSLLLLATFVLSTIAMAQDLRIADAYPDKARYAPGESIRITVELNGHAQNRDRIAATMSTLGSQVGQCTSKELTPGPQTAPIVLDCTAPTKNFQGYLVDVSLSSQGNSQDAVTTAVDVSSDWTRFPRYGYLAHYSKQEGADPGNWVDRLNRFHITGLQFYDFQYRHDQPLAGTPQEPAPEWKDIAGREVDRDVILDLISETHRHNMQAMAYNSSYSAFADVFTRQQNPLPLRWATWADAHGPRNIDTAKTFTLPQGWSTPRLFYMNQNDPGWQKYLFGEMGRLFQGYPFDGWHIDTFGERQTFAYDGKPVDYIAGFEPFINNAHKTLNKPVVFNAVNTMGQVRISHSAAEFVYSELWEKNETFDGIRAAAEEVRVANPNKAFVIAAYVGFHDNNGGPPPLRKTFNLPAVLLTDAAIFSSGASHIELGDGEQMLTGPYFPADAPMENTAGLTESLRHYYDFLTAYEVYLRDRMAPVSTAVSIKDFPTSSTAVPNTLWTAVRKNGETSVIHVINLRGSDDPHWRDVAMTRPPAPILHDLKLTIDVDNAPTQVGWASPDVDGGRFHTLSYKVVRSGKSQRLIITLPMLHYWDIVVFKMHAP